MKKLFYLHWNQQELEERLAPLRKLPVEIMWHWSTQDVIKFDKALPDIFVVSLERLPSHGRQYVQWLWEAKKRQHIPVIFVDGKPEKIEETRTKFPTAIYTGSESLPATIKTLL